jgi:hypothetical protein
VFRITSFFPIFMALIALQLREQKVQVTSKDRDNRNRHINVINKKKTLTDLKSFLSKPTIYK